VNDDWVGFAAASIVLAGSFALVIVVVWQVAVTWRARIVASRDRAYQQLAEEAVATQRQAAADLADLRERVASIEKLLREVG
jgi:type VI protein secretion system component VasK